MGDVAKDLAARRSAAGGTLGAEAPRAYKGTGAPLAAFNAVHFTVRGQMEAVLRSGPGVPLTIDAF